MSGILGLVILGLDIWAIVDVFKSTKAMSHKILWTVLVLILPVLGLILYFLVGRK